MNKIFTGKNSLSEIDAAGENVVDIVDNSVHKSIFPKKMDFSMWITL